MAKNPSERGCPVTVEWRRAVTEPVSPPVVRRCPYLELTLEHPDLEATGQAERFFPDAVPYEHRGDHRVFYWRPALKPSSTAPADWTLACATTHGLTGVDRLPWSGAPLTTDGDDRTTVVVDGTVGGDAATTRVGSYAEPAVRVTAASRTAVELVAAGTQYRVAAGDRRRIPLSERRVEPIDGERSTTVTPVLAVRYPGERVIHHPARGASYRLFPSFGLDLDDVATPVAVPTAGGELDHAALAADLGVDRSARPYPERVLWQAFAYTAFDPHAEAVPEIAQFESGHLALLRGNFEP